LQVSVRFFSYLINLFNTGQIELNLPEHARMADLTRRLQELYPQHSALIAQLVFLVDEKRTTPQTVLTEGAQVLALMLLSGGESSF
jgi:molybdopterin converting factor small subunit